MIKSVSLIKILLDTETNTSFRKLEKSHEKKEKKK